MPEPSSNRPCLTVLGGPMAGTRFELEEEVDNILIGSDPSCRFCLPLGGVSPVHARLWIDRSGATVYDTNSPRGLYVNDDRVNGQLPLRNGDILWLGTPGEEEVVMIQCRLPPREPEAAAKPMPALASVADARETMALGSNMGVQPEPEPSVDYVEAVDVAEPYGVAEAVESGETLESDERAVLEEWRRPSLEEAPTLSSKLGATGGAPHPPHFEVDIEDTSAGRAALASRGAPPPPPEPTYEPHAAPYSPPAHAPTRPEPVQARVEGRTPIPTAVPAMTSTPAPVPNPAARGAQPASTPVPRRAAAERISTKTPVPAPVKAPSSSSGRWVVLGVLALLLVGAAAGVALWLRGRKPVEVAALPSALPSTAPVPTPVAAASEALSPQVQAEPQVAPPAPVVEEVTIVKSPTLAPIAAPSSSPSVKPASPRPPPLPSAPASGRPPSPAVAAPMPDPRAQQTAAQVAALLTQATGALEAGNLETAAGHFEEVLKLEPQNARALEGKGRTQAALAVSRKAFVPGRTAVKTEAAAGKALSGFETEDVSLQRAPDFLGRIDFEVSPARVQPGAAYNVKVYVANEGKKPIKVRGVSVKTSVNGAASDAPASTKAKEIAPRQRVLVLETGGEWKADTSSWSMDVEVTGDKGASLKNRLSWK